MAYDHLKLDHQLCFPLYATSRLVVKHYKPFLDPLELTYTQYITLLALWEEDHLTVTSLGDKLFLDSGTLTPLLKKLELQGLITRTRRPEDERSVRISLTEKGHALKEKASDIPGRLATCLPLPDEDAKTLHRILHYLLKLDPQNNCNP